jgi:hypothetical protein
VSVENGGLRAAVIDHDKGLGECRYGDDVVSFTGGYLALAADKDHAVFSSPAGGEVRVRIKAMAAPAKLVRVFLDGRIEDAAFDWSEEMLVFAYNAGAGADRTDMYVSLGEGVTLGEAVGEYLGRIQPKE